MLREGRCRMVDHGHGRHRRVLHHRIWRWSHQRDACPGRNARYDSHPHAAGGLDDTDDNPGHDPGRGAGHRGERIQSHDNHHRNPKSNFQPFFTWFDWYYATDFASVEAAKAKRRAEAAKSN